MAGDEHARQVPQGGVRGFIWFLRVMWNEEGRDGKLIVLLTLLALVGGLAVVAFLAADLMGAIP